MGAKKILFITNGTEITASSRARVYNYRPFLEKEGYGVNIIPYNTLLDTRLKPGRKRRPFAAIVLSKLNHFFKCLIYLCIAPGYDLVFIQRVLLPKTIFTMLKWLHRKVVFDFDDAIYMADRWSFPFLGRNRFFKRFRHILKGADYVIVSNEVLKEVAAKLNLNVIRLPTPVDTDKITPKNSREHNGSVTVGWIGSPGTTRYLEDTKEVFEILCKKYPFLKIKLIGVGPLYRWRANMIMKEWRLEDEPRDLKGMDIGIMPLAFDEWSAAKAGYKLLLYMAAGIPCVASPVGVNKDIIEEGLTGFFASTTQEWLERLSEIIEDRGLRERMGGEGRNKAERVYSYQANAPKLIRILKEIISG